MAADADKPSLTAVAETLSDLSTSDVSEKSLDEHIDLILETVDGIYGREG